MSGLFLTVITLLCWAGGVLGMCSIKRYPPSVDEWYSCVPCPPPRKFSLLCLNFTCTSDCKVLSKLLEICLSQYSQQYQQWFTEDIKCLEKRACVDKRPFCIQELKTVFQNISDSCVQRPDHSSTTRYFTTTTPHYTKTTTFTVSTTHVRTTQTTNDHVTNYTESSTTPFIEVSNVTLMTTTNASIPREPPRIESNIYNLFIIISIIVIVLVAVAAVCFAIWKVNQIYYVNFKSPLDRQISTDSRSPIIRGENGCDILCVMLKRKVTSQDNGHLTPKEIQRGYYNPVPEGETKILTVFHSNELFDEDVNIGVNCDDMGCPEAKSITEDVDQETGNEGLKQ